MLRHLALIAVLATTACDPAPRSDHPSPLPPSQAWLVGTWTAEGESCESDAGIIYQANRTWLAEGAGGTWRLRGNRLETFVTEQMEDGPPVRLARPERHLQTVEVTGPDAFRTRLEDGSILSLRRCPG